MRRSGFNDFDIYIIKKKNSLLYRYNKTNNDNWMFVIMRFYRPNKSLVIVIIHHVNYRRLLMQVKHDIFGKYFTWALRLYLIENTTYSDIAHYFYKLFQSTHSKMLNTNLINSLLFIIAFLVRQKSRHIIIVSKIFTNHQQRHCIKNNNNKVKITDKLIYCSAVSVSV